MEDETCAGLSLSDNTLGWGRGCDVDSSGFKVLCCCAARMWEVWVVHCLLGNKETACRHCGATTELQLQRHLFAKYCWLNSRWVWRLSISISAYERDIPDFSPVFPIFTITAVSFWLEKRPKLQTNSGDVSPLNLKPTPSEAGRIGALARKSKMWQECFYVFNGPVKLEVNYCCPTRQSFKRPLLKPPRRARTELRSSLFYYYYLWVCFCFFSCSICLFNHPLMFYC